MWRTILISQGGKLSLKQNQLSIWQEKGEFCVPIEDIAVIIIENREVVITSPLLSALALNGVTLLTCDEQFLPCGQWLPFHQYHRQLKILKLQISMSQPFKKQLWQRIIQQKINHQAFVLAQMGKIQESKTLVAMSKRVRSGDPDNLEAYAAQVYFPILFGQGFTRTQENDINAHLNYAYTILRSAISRALVLYGYLPALGIFHHSELNAFNLSDDFIEPLRPLVDLLVYQLSQQQKLEPTLTPTAKQQMIKILNYQMQVDQQKVNVLTAIDKMIGSLQASILNRQADKLKLPSIIPLAEHNYE